jgi:tocopherol O-methyltransferase
MGFAVAATPRSASMRKLIAFYEGKTRSILRRYGPGPRVHYHTGFMTDLPPTTASTVELRCCLVAAQERMLHDASAAWRIASVPFREVLDVGCGLGGGAIFWAQQFGASVTAVTVAPSHVELVARFAKEAGVASLVRPLLSDALFVPGENCYDAAVAIDSSSSFERAPWFRRLNGLVRPGGHIFVADCFLERREYEEAFNRHWRALIGTVDEYVAEARRAGFRHDTMEDVSSRALHFWDTTINLIRAETQDSATNHSERINLQESLRVHSLVRKGLSDGGLRHTLMSFIRE